jgi:hypothetical protein
VTSQGLLRGYAFDYNGNFRRLSPVLKRMPMTLEERTARLTILIDPRKKALFEHLCAEEDATPSQVVRRLIRRYIEERTGQPWTPGAVPRGAEGGRAGRTGANVRRRAAR